MDPSGTTFSSLRIYLIVSVLVTSGMRGWISSPHSGDSPYRWVMTATFWSKSIIQSNWHLSPGTDLLHTIILLKSPFHSYPTTKPLSGVPSCYLCVWVCEWMHHNLLLWNTQIFWCMWIEGFFSLVLAQYWYKDITYKIQKYKSHHWYKDPGCFIRPISLLCQDSNSNSSH